MEKNIVLWIIGIIVLAVVLSNFGGFTGNIAREATKEVDQPLLTIRNANVQQGYMLQMNARNVGGLQEFKLFTESGKYTGKRFFSRDTNCEMQKNGMRECEVEYRIPPSMESGRYYVQAKSKRTGELAGNKALFTVS
ncbi:hypothetical protein J4443_05255 [Candidatus Woesearchaeota archaeon]|nr:hypothetical protein [Candidatus Woesearchaeota archaeon]